MIYINKIKYSIEDKHLKPFSYFLIPSLIIKNSKELKSSAGFDAISQAVESLVSVKSTLKSIAFSEKSLNLSLKNYLNFIKKPSFENCSKMSLAAMYSGRAISITKTTAPHAVSYPFTSLFNISHGHAVSLTLEKFPSPLDLLIGIATSINPINNIIQPPSAIMEPAIVSANPTANIDKSIINCWIFFSIIIYIMN